MVSILLGNICKHAIMAVGTKQGAEMRKFSREAQRRKGIEPAGCLDKERRVNCRAVQSKLAANASRFARDFLAFAQYWRQSLQDFPDMAIGLRPCCQFSFCILQSSLPLVTTARDRQFAKRATTGHENGQGADKSGQKRTNRRFPAESPGPLGRLRPQTAPFVSRTGEKQSRTSAFRHAAHGTSPSCDDHQERHEHEEP